MFANLYNYIDLYFSLVLLSFNLFLAISTIIFIDFLANSSVWIRNCKVYNVHKKWKMHGYNAADQWLRYICKAEIVSSVPSEINITKTHPCNIQIFLKLYTLKFSVEFVC